jgi:hypothetical protein
MKRILWVSNHPCNAEQKNDLSKMFGQVKIIELNEPGWSQINPDHDINEVGEHLAGFIPALTHFDHVVVMGELSACLNVVSWCVQLQVPCWTPTTKRDSKEEIMPDGSTRKVNVFRHCRFRNLFQPE